jgi:putative transcriptional regulator
MTITHHPSFESLMSCSAGSMPEAMAAVMASHMSMCPECQKELALMEQIGAALFDQLSPASVNAAAPVMALRASEADAGKPSAQPLPGGDIPEPLNTIVGRYLDDVRWTSLVPGIQVHDIALSPGAKGALKLIKVAPGKVLPQHSHTGSELTLVLRGACKDATGHYKVGDVADLSEETSHQPVADPEQGCVCLIATEHKLRFKGVVARLLQPITGM